MGKSKNISRIYFLKNKFHYSFCWVDIGTDNSIYFGSSINKKFKFGFSKTLEATSETRLDILGIRREMETKELNGKYSLHTSGIALLPILNQDNRRTEYEIKPMHDYPENIPIAGILPMPFHRYEKSNKKIKNIDVVIDIDKFNDFPFGVFVYAHKISAEKPVVIKKLELDYSIFSEESVSINGDLAITVISYSSPDKFLITYFDELVITSRPDPNTLEPSWPIFIST